jgi:hypothetical protein
MTVWIYVDTSKDVGDQDQLKVFESEAAANEWLKENDPEGVAFEYDVLSDPPRPYIVHATFLGGMLGKVVSHHPTLDEAIVAATARADKSRAIVFNNLIVWPPAT